MSSSPAANCQLKNVLTLGRLRLAQSVRMKGPEDDAVEQSAHDVATDETAAALAGKQQDRALAAEGPSGDLDPVAEGDEEGDAANDAQAAVAAEAEAPGAAEAAASTSAAPGKPTSIKNTCRVRECPSHPLALI